MGSSRLQAKRQLLARRDTVKTEATAAEKDCHRKYTKANNGCRDAPLSMTRQFSAARTFYPQLLFPLTINNF
jgi:hypothetical protein